MTRSATTIPCTSGPPAVKIARFFWWEDMAAGLVGHDDSAHLQLVAPVPLADTRRTKTSAGERPSSIKPRPPPESGTAPLATLLAAVLVVVAVPLAFDPAGFFMFLPVKWAIALALVPLGVAGVLVGRQRFPHTQLTWPWLALLAVIGVGVVASANPVISVIGAPGRNLGFVAWVLFALAFCLGASVEEHGRRRVVLAASTASLAVSAYALAQVAGLDWLRWEEGVDLSRGRFTFGNAAFLGAYLVVIVPVAGRLALDEELRRRDRCIHVAAAGLGLAALVATGARGAWVGLLAAALVLVALEWSRLRGLRHSRGIPASVMLAVAAVVTFSMAAGLRMISDGDHGPRAARGRVPQWQVASKLIAEGPLLGGGPDAFAAAAPAPIDAEFEGGVGRERLPDGAQNVFLDVVTSTGVVGLVAFLVLLATLFGATWRRAGRSPLTAGLFAACVGHLVQMQFGFPFVEVDVVLWLMAGILVAGCGKATLKRVPAAPAVGAMLAVLAVVGSGWALREVVADRHLRAGLEAEAAGDHERAGEKLDKAAATAPERTQYIEAAAGYHGRRAEDTGDPNELAVALSQTKKAGRQAGDDPRLLLAEGDLLLAKGRSTSGPLEARAAERALRAALEKDRNSSRGWLKLGVALAQQGRNQEAQDAWLQAASLSPRSPAPWLNVAAMSERSGRPDLAVMAYSRALEIEPGNAAARQGVQRARTSLARPGTAAQGKRQP